MVLITCARSVHAAGSAAKERKAVARVCRCVRFSRPTATGGALFVRFFLFLMRSFLNLFFLVFNLVFSTSVALVVRGVGRVK